MSGRGTLAPNEKPCVSGAFLMAYEACTSSKQAARDDKGPSWVAFGVSVGRCPRPFEPRLRSASIAGARRTTLRLHRSRGADSGADETRLPAVRRGRTHARRCRPQSRRPRLASPLATSAIRTYGWRANRRGGLVPNGRYASAFRRRLSQTTRPGGAGWRGSSSGVTREFNALARVTPTQGQTGTRRHGNQSEEDGDVI